ncbi:MULTISPECIES: STAS domain-containing protein [Geobacillus]|jgi:anti-anti-sigma factor|uniref:Anti-sigma factor (Antagonist of SpoIIAB) n=2 Tax=Geobacillus thermodenitrificans TaxID=33940 RepID=A4INE2_GEOTN|nr:MULTISPECIES: STAS domain-containing protein [Geobacillus]ABO66846.1 Anti-sigma factor (antagonist of SpoIIAB) [Geobacillus thermodenitrificans NG80-2]
MMKQHWLSFELEMITEPAYECIKLTGRLAYDTQLAAEQKLLVAAAAVKRRLVVIDVSGLQFLDSTGLAFLVRFFKQVVSANRAMAMIVRDNAVLKKILLIAKLDRLLPIVADEQELLSLPPLRSPDSIGQEELYSAWQQCRS